MLEMANQGQLRVPEFQRDFVWEPSHIHDLLVSVSRSYPAGSLLFLKQGVSPAFELRLVDGVDLPKTEPLPVGQLVLDGQQRITALYQSLYGKGKHRFFLDLRKLKEVKDFEDSLFYLDEEDATKRYSDRTKQFEGFVLPLATVFDKTFNFDRWMDECIDYHESNRPGHRTELRTWLRNTYDEFLKPIYEYEFPVVDLEAQTPPLAICNIFVSVNTTGVKLTTFELLTARLYPGGTRMRQLWRDAREANDNIRRFLREEDADYLLKVVALLKGPSGGAEFPSCKKADLLDITKEDIQSFWDRAVTYTEKSLAFLKGDFGVTSRNWVPYITIVPPLAAAFAELEETAHGVDLGQGREKLKLWFWCSVFSRRYDTATDTKSAEDYVALKNWFKGGEPPPPVKELKASKFDANILRTVTRQSSALYRGVLCLLIRNGALDFHKQTRISTLSLEAEDIDDHHVFPQKYLNNNYDLSEINCILNRTLIDSRTNKTIQANPPSVYLGLIKQTVGQSKLEEILKSHLLIIDGSSPLFVDKFREFLDERQSVIQNLIDKVTQVSLI